MARDTIVLNIEEKGRKLMSIPLSPSNSVLKTPKVKIVNNYFDGLTVTKKQIFLYIIIVLAYFLNNLITITFPSLLQR